MKQRHKILLIASIIYVVGISVTFIADGTIISLVSGITGGLIFLATIFYYTIYDINKEEKLYKLHEDIRPYHTDKDVTVVKKLSKDYKYS